MMDKQPQYFMNPIFLVGFFKEMFSNFFVSIIFTFFEGEGGLVRSTLFKIISCFYQTILLEAKNLSFFQKASFYLNFFSLFMLLDKIFNCFSR